MRRWCLILLLVAGCTGGSGERESPAPEVTAFAAEARTATRALQVELQQALSQAMQEGGPVRALSVCNEKAPEIAMKVSEDEGLRVRRVSEQNRNPENAATATELEVLRWFEAHPAAVDTVIHVEGEMVYMRPIRVGVDLCLRCHGDRDALSPELQQALAELYPEDRAVGFGMGDLRGAFVVERAPAGR